MDDCSLNELHDIIQIAMGWEDEHMHAFVIDGEEYGNPRIGSEAEYDSRFVRLSKIMEQGHTRFRYDYDFGDDWKHIIEVEKTLPAEKGVCYPRYVKGERACPPEDCGVPYVTVATGAGRASWRLPGKSDDSRPSGKAGESRLGEGGRR
jgi:hypothetical protein